MKCPRCADEDVRRSYRQPLEKLLFAAFALSPFRCRRCRNRFWRLERPLVTAPRVVLLAVALALSGVWLVRSFDWMGSAAAASFSEERGASGLVTAHQPPAPKPETAVPSPTAEVAFAAPGREDLSRGTSTLEQPMPSRQEAVSNLPERAELPSAKPSPTSAIEALAKPESPVAQREVPAAVRSKVAQPVERPAAQGLQLQRLRAVARSSWLDIEVVTGYPIQNYRSFADALGSRIVVDLPGAWSSELPASLRLEHHLVSAVLVERFEDRLRIQVDLSVDGLPVPEVEPRDYGLVIRVLPVPLQPFGR